MRNENQGITIDQMYLFLSINEKIFNMLKTQKGRKKLAVMQIKNKDKKC